MIRHGDLRRFRGSSSRWVCRPLGALAVLALLAVFGAQVVFAAEPVDEPGSRSRADEPGGTVERQPSIRSVPAASNIPAFRLELGFGLSSLVVDPEMEQGIGGGLYLAYGLHRRVGVEVTGFFGRNKYGGTLGTYGASFLAGDIALGPIFQLTRPGSRFSVTADLGLGAYVVVPFLQESVWSLGLSGGVTLGLRLTRWFGVGLKVRYHLFNLARIAGPELKDMKALMKVGVIDRLEIPAYAAFYF
jgi:hypothetical protein